MHAYIVFAHPTRRSFTGAVLDAFCRGLEEAGHTFEIGDLYAMGFRSDMTLAEYERETNVHGNRAHSALPADVRAEHDKIAHADGLAFVFPVWWSDCPAKMKGWFDRVWVCGYAYDYGLPDETFSYPRLSIARALVLCPGGNTGDAFQQSGVAEACGGSLPTTACNRASVSAIANSSSFPAPKTPTRPARRESATWRPPIAPEVGSSPRMPGPSPSEQAGQIRSERAGFSLKQ